MLVNAGKVGSYHRVTTGQQQVQASGINRLIQPTTPGVCGSFRTRKLCPAAVTETALERTPVSQRHAG